MAVTHEFKATKRDRVGKGASRELRRQGLIPAVIYGDKKPPLAISLPLKETTVRLHAGGFLTHIANVDVDGEKIAVIPRDYELDPVRDTLIHVDFLRVSSTSRIRLFVPCHFINQDQSPGIKRGGALNISAHEIEVEVSADAVPERLEIDIASLNIGDSVLLSAVKLPVGATVIGHSADFPIASIIGHGAVDAE